jgi:hypothetical protein
MLTENHANLAIVYVLAVRGREFVVIASPPVTASISSRGIWPVIVSHAGFTRR